MKQASPYRCALITGASSGLGSEFARQLVACCDILVLVARRIELLEQLAGELASISPNTEVLWFKSDLTKNDQVDGFCDSLSSKGLAPDLLVNNAGMGDYGEFETSDWSKINAMLQINMVALTRLTHHFLPAMIARGSGNILNVSSLASTLPITDFAVYAATKAYVTSFSEALRIEVRDHGVNVLALCPGPVHTGFGSVAQRGELGNVTPGGEWAYVSSRQVVTEGIKAMRKGKARHYPGIKMAAVAIAISMMPMKVIRLIMGRRPRRRPSL